MPKFKSSVPDHIVDKFGTDSVDAIKDAKLAADGGSKQFFENVIQEKALSSDEFKAALKRLNIAYRKELEERQAVFVISTEDPDRDGDIVKANGIDLEDYQKNPVVLFAHDSRSLPIGVSLKVYKQAKQTKAVVMFFDDQIDNTGTSETIYRYVVAGGIKGASIGFRTIKARYPEAKEAEELGMGKYGVIFEKIALLEWSVVTIPANQNALRSKGLSDANIKGLKDLGVVSEDEEELGIDDVLEDDEQSKKLDEAIILLKALSDRLNVIDEKVKDIESKMSDPVHKGSEQSDDNLYGDILTDIETAINSLKS